MCLVVSGMKAIQTPDSENCILISEVALDYRSSSNCSGVYLKWVQKDLMPCYMRKLDVYI